jgi:hypothetical protein
VVVNTGTTVALANQKQSQLAINNQSVPTTSNYNPATGTLSITTSAPVSLGTVTSQGVPGAVSIAPVVSSGGGGGGGGSSNATSAPSTIPIPTGATALLNGGNPSSASYVLNGVVYNDYGTALYASNPNQTLVGGIPVGGNSPNTQSIAPNSPGYVAPATATPTPVQSTQATPALPQGAVGNYQQLGNLGLAVPITSSVALGANSPANAIYYSPGGEPTYYFIPNLPANQVATLTSADVLPATSNVNLNYAQFGKNAAIQITGNQYSGSYVQNGQTYNFSGTLPSNVLGNPVQANNAAVDSAYTGVVQAAQNLIEYNNVTASQGYLKTPININTDTGEITGGGYTVGGSTATPASQTISFTQLGITPYTNTAYSPTGTALPQAAVPSITVNYNSAGVPTSFTNANGQTVQSLIVPYGGQSYSFSIGTDTNEYNQLIGGLTEPNPDYRQTAVLYSVGNQEPQVTNALTALQAANQAAITANAEYAQGGLGPGATNYQLSVIPSGINYGQIIPGVGPEVPVGFKTAPLNIPASPLLAKGLGAYGIPSYTYQNQPQQPVLPNPITQEQLNAFAASPLKSLLNPSYYEALLGEVSPTAYRQLASILPKLATANQNTVAALSGNQQSTTPSQISATEAEFLTSAQLANQPQATPATVPPNANTLPPLNFKTLYPNNYLNTTVLSDYYNYLLNQGLTEFSQPNAPGTINNLFGTNYSTNPFRAALLAGPTLNAYAQDLVVQAYNPIRKAISGAASKYPSTAQIVPPNQQGQNGVYFNPYESAVLAANKYLPKVQPYNPQAQAITTALQYNPLGQAGIPVVSPLARYAGANLAYPATPNANGLQSALSLASILVPAVSPELAVKGALTFGAASAVGTAIGNVYFGLPVDPDTLKQAFVEGAQFGSIAEPAFSYIAPYLASLGSGLYKSSELPVYLDTISKYLQSIQINPLPLGEALGAALPSTTEEALSNGIPEVTEAGEPIRPFQFLGENNGLPYYARVPLESGISAGANVGLTNLGSYATGNGLATSQQNAQAAITGAAFPTVAEIAGTNALY